MPNIMLTPNGYKSFILDLRSRFAGRPQGNVEYDFLANGGVIKSFRFRTNDEYICAVKNSAGAAWRPITEHEGHYSHMGKPNVPLGLEAIKTAFNADFSLPYSIAKKPNEIGEEKGWHKQLIIIIAFTSEAARSDTVYRQCQLAIHGHAELVYSNIWRYINTYSDTRVRNGLAANVFRALGDEDYR
jgi:hypothetical protein